LKEKHKFLLLLIIAIIIGLITGLLFGYITGLASSALGIVEFNEDRND